MLTHFIVSSDVARSRRFYTEVLGGETVLEGEPSIVALANGWVIINTGGGPDRGQAVGDARDACRPKSYEQLPKYSRRRHPCGVCGVEFDGERSSLHHPRTAAARSVATSAIRMGT